MPPLSRRSFVGGIAVGALGALSAPAWVALSRGPGAAGVPRPRKVAASSHSPVVEENMLSGSRGWVLGRGDSKIADDKQQQIQGFTSQVSIDLGESIDFHVTVFDESDFTIDIYRMGNYRGSGGRRVSRSLPLHGVKQPAPQIDEKTGLAWCDWTVSWTLNVPVDWTSGCYVAVFTSASGWSSATLFVVRDDRREAKFCVVLPFSTYQAYNMWPIDGLRGRNFYRGFGPSAPSQRSGGQTNPNGEAARSAIKVSFDRPYGAGRLPREFANDHEFIRWVEAHGFDVTYATSVDLHAGRVDVSRYDAVVFCGHDEYWSTAMRDAAAKAIDIGTSLVFLGANSAYWHIRFEAGPDDRPDRVVTCFKGRYDPSPDRVGATIRWRDIEPPQSLAEQQLMGVQYEAMVASPTSLVVTSAKHWFWRGTGVRDGDKIPDVVAGEADGLDWRVRTPADSRQALLAASPYRRRGGGKRIQNTSLIETRAGGLVFASGTLGWTQALNSAPGDERIGIATSNLFRRIGAA